MSTVKHTGAIIDDAAKAEILKHIEAMLGEPGVEVEVVNHLVRLPPVGGCYDEHEYIGRTVLVSTNSPAFHRASRALADMPTERLP